MSEHLDAVDAMASKLYGKTTAGARENRAPAGPNYGTPTVIGESPSTAKQPAKDAPDAGRPEPGEGDRSRAEREQSEDAEPNLYKAEVQYASSLDPGVQTLADAYSLSEEQKAEVKRNTTEIFAELEIPPQRANVLHGLHVHFVREPASEEVAKGWAKSSRAALRLRYGDQMGERIKVAREYVASRKGLHDLLHHSGLTNHPEVVAEIVERAWAFRNRQASKKGAGR